MMYYLAIIPRTLAYVHMCVLARSLIGDSSALIEQLAVIQAEMLSLSVVVEIIREKCNVIIRREREREILRTVTLYDNEINVNKYVDLSLNREQLAMQIPRKRRLFRKFLRTYLGMH